ncbi:MAG: hypothetical protein AAGI17_06355 [Planctomycetota bacterium]
MKTALAAVAMAAGTAVAQPTISVMPSISLGLGGDSFSVTVAITGIDFNPFAPLTGLPAPAPTSFQIEVEIDGGNARRTERFRIREGSASADQVRNIDVDGLFGPQPATSFFTSTVLDGGRRIQASNAALVFGQVDPSGGLFDDGALFTFLIDSDADVAGTELRIIVRSPDPSADAFFADVLDYGTAGDVPGSAAGGPGSALLGSATVWFLPAPNSAVALALGGLIASRRRR